MADCLELNLLQLHSTQSLCSQGTKKTTKKQHHCIKVLFVLRWLTSHYKALPLQFKGNDVDIRFQEHGRLVQAYFCKLCLLMRRMKQMPENNANPPPTSPKKSWLLRHAQATASGFGHQGLGKEQMCAQPIQLWCNT